MSIVTPKNGTALASVSTFGYNTGEEEQIVVGVIKSGSIW